MHVFFLGCRFRTLGMSNSSLEPSPPMGGGGGAFLEPSPVGDSEPGVFGGSGPPPQRVCKELQRHQLSD